MVVAPDVQLTAPPKPSIEECTYRLGAFMTAWDQIDMATFYLFQKLVDTNPRTAIILYRGALTDAGARRDVIDALAKERLLAADKVAVASVLRRLKAITTKRNRLVHGSWTLSIQVFRDKEGKKRAVIGNWMRQYHQTDLAKNLEMLKNAAIRRKFAYSSRQIASLTQAAHAFSREIRVLSDRLVLQPYRVPQPIDIS